MSELPRVKVVNPGDDWLGTEYYINNQKIERVKSIDFRVAVDEMPTFTFETMGLPDIDMPGDIWFSFTTKTITEAVKVLRNELLKHGTLYAGFWKSIESAVKENTKLYGDGYNEIMLDGISEFDFAGKILDRIIGEEI